MNSELRVVLQQLIRGRMIAALGTLHQGAPFVSMVTFAAAGNGSLILHVSQLAAHTQDMLVNPDVSLLITESAASGKMPQALARVTVQGRAEMLDRESENTPMHEKSICRDSRMQHRYLNFRISPFSSSNRFQPVSLPGSAKLSPLLLRIS
jgi:putative heme iron utilization protein